MEKMFRCDSCGRLKPKAKLTEVEYIHTDVQQSKDQLTTLTKHGMVCKECISPEKETAETTKAGSSAKTSTSSRGPSTTKR